MKQSHHLLVSPRGSTRRLLLSAALGAAVVLTPTTPLAAQQSQSPTPSARPSAAPPQPVDTVPVVFRRAQRLVNDGNGAAGRALIDSVLTASPPRSSAEAEALFWRATLAESWEAAQRDYLRIMLEHERLPLAASAMYRLAQGESARGDREAAVRYLERLEREAPTSPMRADAGLLHGRLLVEGGLGTDACGVLRANRSFVRAGAIELENQYDYLLRACPAEGVAAIAAEPTRMAPPPKTSAPTSSAPTSSAPTTSAPTTSAPTTPAPTTPAPTSAAPTASAQTGRWSVQAAAFSAANEAREFAQVLTDRGYPARVDGNTAPFRVRFGHFPTREAAAAASEAYKQKESADAFIVQVPRG